MDRGGNNLLNNNGFTLVELLAVIVVLSIVMIIAIPNILSTMSTSKKEALKIYAEKTLSEAQKQYETEKLSGITPGEETSGSKFTERGDYGLVIKISDLFSDCPLILKDDGKYYELRMSGVSVSGFDDTPVQVYLRKGDRIYKKDLRDVK